MVKHSADPQPTFAGPDALSPCMTEFCVAGISTALEPSTTTSATAAFTKFLDNAALGTAVAGHQG